MGVPLVPDLRASELEGARFSCLEGCGFCCTMQPEVSRLDLARLRQRLAPKPVLVTFGGERTYLQLQNKCGACTLLDRRGCSAYEDRPAHCRYFPFHVHFAEWPEVYVNRTCRGVERAPGGRLHDAFASQVLENARSDEVTKHLKDARDTYGQFRRLARRAKAWGEADAVLARARSDGAAAFERDWIEQATREADEPLDVEGMLEDSLRPFAASDPARRPYYLTPELEWLTFEPDGPNALRVLEMDEAGGLKPRGRIEGVREWSDVPPGVAHELAGYLALLTTRRVFTGSAYAVVDDADYTTTVEEAAWWRLAEVATDLALRVRLLRGLGVPQERLAHEAERFYDTTFLDAPAIGGFL